MLFYHKVIAAVVGLVVLVASRYGLDLEKDQQALTEIIITVATGLWVYFAKNKPTTEAQVEKVREVTNEAAKEIRDA